MRPIKLHNPRVTLTLIGHVTVYVGMTSKRAVGTLTHMHILYILYFVLAIMPTGACKSV